jgi:hypothetical protein
MNDLVRRVLRASGDKREVIADDAARYFGAEINDESLVTGPGARMGAKRFEDWLKEFTSKKPVAQTTPRPSVASR